MSTTPAPAATRTPSAGSVDLDSDPVPPPAPRRTRDFGLLPIPPTLQHDPDRPFHFTAVLNIAFGFASTMTVCNLYYCQPLLIRLAESFGVDDGRVSSIPTLTQAGYATGILLISPLGDLIPRRPLVLLLITLSTLATLGLALSHSLPLFQFFSFAVGVVTVTPQVLIPLAADLAPPHRRASAISVVLAGLLLGILWARVIAGIIAEFSRGTDGWRNVYWMALGAQGITWLAMYLLIPDWPGKNKDGKLTYFGILWSMAKMAVTEPLLIQSCLIGGLYSAVFANFWVTLTFLLGGPPYFYTTLQIGLFGLIGILGVCTAPLVGRIIDRLVPWLTTLISLLVVLAFQAIDFGAAEMSIGAVIVTCFGLDVGGQMQQISSTTRIYSISQSARARLNACFVISIFLGQVMGTAVGTKVFVEHGARAASGLSLGWAGFAILVLFVRGPQVSRYTWFGWDGGADMRKSAEKDAVPADQEKVQVAQSMDPEKGEVTG